MGFSEVSLVNDSAVDLQAEGFQSYMSEALYKLVCTDESYSSLVNVAALVTFEYYDKSGQLFTKIDVPTGSCDTLLEAVSASGSS